MEVATRMDGEKLETATAKEALSEADQIVEQAKKDASLFEVAINCFLRHGQ